MQNNYEAKKIQTGVVGVATALLAARAALAAAIAILAVMPSALGEALVCAKTV